MTVQLSVPVAGDRYLRRFEAEIDIVAADRIFVRGRMSDHRMDLEHAWLLATPRYEIIEASARQHAGSPEHADPTLCARYTAARGVSIGRGFTKRILEALGDEAPGRQEHLLLAIEMARVGQQIYQFPPGFDEGFPPRPGVLSAEALSAWEKDRSYMPSLAESCHTYRDASAPLFRERRIVSSVGPALTRPAPGTKRAFWRRKQLCIRPADGGFECESAMEDSLHDIRIGFRVDAGGIVSAPRSRAERVPYTGLCEDAQQRSAGLAGLKLTAQFVSELAGQVGGASGCTHLFDLSVDCLRLLRL